MCLGHLQLVEVSGLTERKVENSRSDSCQAQEKRSSEARVLSVTYKNDHRRIWPKVYDLDRQLFSRICLSGGHQTWRAPLPFCLALYYEVRQYPATCDHDQRPV